MRASPRARPVEGFIFFHHKRHPAEMGEKEITQFLTALAVERHVSASTQNQALAAVLFLGGFPPLWPPPATGEG